MTSRLEKSITNLRLSLVKYAWVSWCVCVFDWVYFYFIHYVDVRQNTMVYNRDIGNAVVVNCNVRFSTARIKFLCAEWTSVAVRITWPEMESVVYTVTVFWIVKPYRRECQICGFLHVNLSSSLLSLFVFMSPSLPLCVIPPSCNVVPTTQITDLSSTRGSDCRVLWSDQKH
jgi:hypothetical protein